MNILSSPLCTDNISRMFSGTVRVKTEKPTGQGEQLARGWLRNWANVDNDITTFGGAWQPCLYVAWFSCIPSLRRWYTAQISYGNKKQIKPILNQYFSSGVDECNPSWPLLATGRMTWESGQKQLTCISNYFVLSLQVGGANIKNYKSAEAYQYLQSAKGGCKLLQQVIDTVFWKADVQLRQSSLSR